MFTSQYTAALKSVHSSLWRWAQDVETMINSIAKQTGADPRGVFPVTPQVNNVSVTAANGIFNVQVQDSGVTNNPSLSGRAITYFVEFSTDSAFNNVVHSEAWHAIRNQNIFLGNQNLFVRAYSQLQGSAPSKPIVFGGAVPIAVIGGGVTAPTQQLYQGSGTSLNSGNGYGVPIRSRV